MTIHDQKHKEQENTVFSMNSKKKPSVIINDEKCVEKITPFVKIAPSVESTPPKTTVVKATGTFYPLSAFSTTQSTSCSITNSYVSSGSISSELLPVNAQDKRYKSNDERLEVTSLTSSGIDHSITQGLSQHSMHSNSLQQSSEKCMMYNHQLSCNQPFCRFIKKDHFHCNVCNQAVQGFSNLKVHVSKHAGASSPVAIYPPGHIKLPSPLSAIEDECGDMSDTDEHTQVPFQNNIQCEGSTDLNALKQDDHQMLPSQLLPWQCSSSSPLRHVIKSNLSENNINSTSHLSGNNTAFFSTPQVECSLIDSVEDSNKNELKRHFAKGFEELNDKEEKIKKMKIAALRILKDEPIPEGYIRCRFNEDCGYSHCGYREHQTHFHCLRKDCGYSFCDKTRFVQHTARHERLDTLMGGDFQQYRANVNCGREECMYANTMGTMANKSSHFHCLKCDFVCTDTNKVVAHRRQHAKMDNIYAAGFEKYTPSQSCNVEGCNHNQKQTHYHCLKCQYSVLGLSQMSSHKYRHIEC